MLNIEMYSFFLIFYLILNLIFNFKKITKISLFVTVFLTLRSCSLHYSLYCFGFVLAPTFIFVILIFSVVKKLNDLSFFLDFRHFFGLQMISFNIRQSWEFARKSFPRLTRITIYCNFLEALVLFLYGFLLLIIILLLVFSMSNLIFEFV